MHMLQTRDPDHKVNRLAELRPLILPDKFTGEEDLREWVAHFDSVSVINRWSDIDKIKWLVICVTGKACVTLKRLIQWSPSLMYQEAIEALQLTFNPPCRRELHKTTFEQ